MIRTVALCYTAVLLLLLPTCLISDDGQNNSIALTFDDLIFSGPDRGLARAEETNKKLLETLKNYKIPAIGFVNENKVGVEGEHERRRAILASWLAAGMELGNHTYSHPDLHHTSLEEYIADFERGEKTTNELLAERGESMRYFRHPFLHAGRSMEIKEKFESYLAKRGYSVAPVTIDNNEYIYAVIYSDAKSRGDEAAMQRIGKAYIPYMEKMTAFYEKASQHIFSRQIPQVLLLHDNEINSDYLDELIEVLKGRGYRFIPLSEALADPAYKSEDTYTGQVGPSWLFRWDFTRGRSFDWKLEPTVDEWVMKAFQNRDR